MNLIESYTPEYILRLQKREENCSCPCCQTTMQQVRLRWQNQIRYSARLGCDSAAREILCREDAFVLHSGEEPVANERVLCPWLQAVNQHCITLMVRGTASLSVTLYTLGIFLSKASQLNDDLSALETLLDELLSLSENGTMIAAFDELPRVDKFRLEALRKLSERDLDASLDPLTGMTMALRQSELRVLTTSYLEESLHELEFQPGLAAFLRERRGVFVNYFLYELYHNVFPGEADWSEAFSRLCLHFFHLKMLCAIAIQGECELDEEMIAALFAAYYRTPSTLYTGENALLVGLSLLK